jgi:hypothetical protein
MLDRRSVVQALKISAHPMTHLIPIVIGIILCIGLFTAFKSEEFLSSVFSGNPTIDTLLGAGLGIVFTGNPINSYIIGRELLKYGVSLMVVTAFIAAWVTVSIVQLPAEIGALGKDFALVRNAVSPVMCLIIAF